MKNEIKDWIIVADKDIIAAQQLMNNNEVAAIAAFHCQQALEKYFKEYFLEQGWELQKTHDLMRLYIEIEKIKDLHIDTDTLLEIDKIYIDTRYPDDYVEPSEKEIEKFYNFAKETGEKIKKELSAGDEL
jgi:HEPN domain-containing protein